MRKWADKYRGVVFTCSLYGSTLSSGPQLSVRAGEWGAQVTVDELTSTGERLLDRVRELQEIIIVEYLCRSECFVELDK